MPETVSNGETDASSRLSRQTSFSRCWFGLQACRHGVVWQKNSREGFTAVQTFLFESLQGFARSVTHNTSQALCAEDQPSWHFVLKTSLCAIDLHGLTHFRMFVCFNTTEKDRFTPSGLYKINLCNRIIGLLFAFRKNILPVFRCRQEVTEVAKPSAEVQVQ